MDVEVRVIDNSKVRPPVLLKKYEISIVLGQGALREKVVQKRLYHLRGGPSGVVPVFVERGLPIFSL